MFVAEKPSQRPIVFHWHHACIGWRVGAIESEIAVIVQHENMKRTCGSVRSSLSVLARLATVGSEAIETNLLHHYDEEAAARRLPRLRASTRSEDRLDDMPNSGELFQAP